MSKINNNNNKIIITTIFSLIIIFINGTTIDEYMKNIEPQLNNKDNNNTNKEPKGDFKPRLKGMTICGLDYLMMEQWMTNAKDYKCYGA